MTVQVYPTTPVAVPLRGTLLDVATVDDSSGYRMIRETEEMFMSYNCMTFQAETDGWCAPATNPKEFATAGWDHGFRFAVQGGVECSTIGFDLDEAEGKVRSVFEAGESAGVERALMRAGFAEGPDDPDNPGTPLWPAATDITPVGGSVSPAVGFALLEGFMADNYAGVPTIHIPRAVGSLLTRTEALVFDGNRLVTKLGSKVAAGAGYDFPNLAPDGTSNGPATERWLYATGEVYLNRGKTFIKQAVDYEDNHATVLVERPYVAVIDCLTVAIHVTLTA